LSSGNKAKISSIVLYFAAKLDDDELLVKNVGREGAKALATPEKDARSANISENVDDFIVVAAD
jgi:hypothetical protein